MNHFELVSLIASRPWAIDGAAGAALCVDVATRIMRGDLHADGNVNPKFECTPYFAEALPTAAIAPQTAAAIARKEGRVAVLPIRGTIMPRASYYGAGLEQISKAAVDLRNDSSVKAIVQDIDSLGGSVEGIVEYGALIREIREVKPVISQVSHRAASAGYWIASQGSEIAVSPSGDVGSIGVITLHANQQGLYQWLGIDMKVLTSSGAPFKAEGHPFGPLSDEAEASIRSDLDSFEAMFFDAVAAGRGTKVSTVKGEFGQGRMVLAEDAVRRGMADRVATLEQTLNRFGASLYGSASRRADADEYARRRQARKSQRRFLQVAHRAR